MSHKLFQEKDAPKCPECGYLLSGACEVGNDDSIPKPGDFSICFGCAKLLVFTENLHLRLPSNKEAVLAGTYPEITKAQLSVLDYLKNRNDQAR